MMGAGMSRVAKQREMTVFVLDPDPATGVAVGELASSLGLPCQTYPSGRAFFAAYKAPWPGCLVLEVQLSDMSGLQVQRRLATMGVPLPTIFLTGHHDVSVAVESMRGGAVHYLQKPLPKIELLSAIQEAMGICRLRWKVLRRRRRLQSGLELLSNQEREVLRGIARDQSNLEIASRLGVSLRTIELWRRNLTKKLKLTSATSLLRFALLADRGDRSSPYQERRLRPDRSAGRRR